MSTKRNGEGALSFAAIPPGRFVLQRYLPVPNLSKLHSCHCLYSSSEGPAADRHCLSTSSGTNASCAKSPSEGSALELESSEKVIVAAGFSLRRLKPAATRAHSFRTLFLRIARGFVLCLCLLTAACQQKMAQQPYYRPLE